jgi:isopentenyldiphosphate isomerase
MENVECFNHKNESLHRTLPRDQMKFAADYFRVVHAWIRNDKGEFLVQKRAKKEDSRPFMWAFTTGMLKPIEDPLEGIIREVSEELQLKTEKAEWSLEKIVSTHVHPYKTHTYVFVMTLQSSWSFEPNTEVSSIMWWDIHKIQKAILETSFWNYPALLNDPDYFKSS